MTTGECGTASSRETAGRQADGVRGVLAYVAGTFPTYSETFVYREVNELRRRGWKVHVCSLRNAGAAEMKGLEALAEGVIGLYGAPWRTAWKSLCEMAGHPVRTAATLGAAMGDACGSQERLGLKARVKVMGQALASLGLARQLRARGVGHIHCHFAHAPTTVGMYAAQQLGVTFSFTGHANDLFERKSLLDRKLARAAFVACISRWHRALYESIRPEGGNAYAIVRCGVDTGQWSVRARTQGAAALRVLTVCRLVRKKGVDLLLRALARYGEGGRGWELRVAGDGPERGVLEALAKSLGCAERVMWLGSLENTRVREEMAEADLFALLCRVDERGDRDGIPVALMEAMACGVPVLTGDIPSIGELVEDGVTGMAESAEDIGAVAGRLEWMADHPEEVAILAGKGRRRIEEEFSLRGNVDRLEERFRGRGVAVAAVRGGGGGIRGGGD